jgi:hypothetical protein
MADSGAGSEKDKGAASASERPKRDAAKKVRIAQNPTVPAQCTCSHSPAAVLLFPPHLGERGASAFAKCLRCVHLSERGASAFAKCLRCVHLSARACACAHTHTVANLLVPSGLGGRAQRARQIECVLYK